MRITHWWKHSFCLDSTVTMSRAPDRKIEGAPIVKSIALELNMYLRCIKTIIICMQAIFLANSFFFLT